MITLRVKTSPLAKFKSTEVEFHGRTLREVLEPMLVDGEFPSPTMVRVNGIPWLRKDWGGYVEDESTVDVVSVVGADPATIFLIANIVTLVFSLGFTAYGIYKARQAMRALKAGLGQYESDPFFTVDGHGNKANLNNPIEVAYGRNRMWPSYIARPYKNYVDDRLNNFVKTTSLTQIFCIGQGAFDVHSVQIGETPAEGFAGLRYEICPPGAKLSQLARICYTQSDFEPFSLTLGNSSSDYTISPNGIGSDLFEVDVDFNWSGGSTSGTHLEDTYEITATAYEIDDSGAIVSSTGVDIVGTRPTNSGDLDNNPPPHRNTFQFTHSSLSNTKRYSVRFKYSDNLLGGSSGELTFLELRSFVSPPVAIEYSDKTLLVMSYLVHEIASDTIVRDKVNVIATRKLKTLYVAGTERTEVTQPTRSIPWAIYDCLTNTVYGGGLAETFLDLESFSDLDGELAKDGVFFDYVFNQNTTVEDAAKVIASAGRCFFSYNGSKLALVRDKCNGIPEAMFSQENIVKDSFSWSAELFDPTDPDSIEASYVTPDSGQEFTTVFTPEGSVGQSVQKLSLQGVGSRTQAWREGAHRMRKLQLIRDTFKFKTGMEGYIPTVGSTAALSWDLTGMGVSGWVEDYDGGWLRLSRFVTVATSGTVLGRVLLRRDDGSASGPFDILEGADGSAGVYKSVRIASVNLDIDFWRTDREPVHFICWSGTGDAPSATKIQVVDVSPSDDRTIEISATNYDQRIYEFDSVAAPSEADETTPVDPGTGSVGVPWVRVESLATPISPEGIPFTRIRWGRYFGTTSYKVYLNGVNIWSGGETYLDWQIDAGIDQVVSVSAMNGATEGSSNSVTFDVGQTAILTNPTIHSGNLTVESDGLLIWWDAVLGASRFMVRVQVDAAYSDWYAIESTAFKYTKSMFKSDFGLLVVSAASVAISFHIKAVISGTDSATSTISTAIDRPSAPSNVVITQDDPIIVDGSRVRRRSLTWEGDSGNTFTILAIAYAVGLQSQYLDFLPHEQFATIPGKSLNTTTPPRYYPSASGFSGVALTKILETSDDFYGTGWKCSYAGLSMGLTVGVLYEDQFWIYPDGDVAGGSYHSGICKSGYSSTEIFIIGLDMVAPISISRIPRYYGKTGALGDNFRVTGAIIADNGWFDASSVAVTTFDIDA